MIRTAGLSLKQKTSIAAAMYHDSPVFIWHGSVRSGKTVSSEIAWLEFIRSGPRGGLLMVGKTLDALERNVLQPMMDMLPPGAMKHTRLSTQCTILGRTVWLMGANDRKAEDRIRGMTLAGAYVDEASLLPDNFWPMLRTRLSVEGAKLFTTTNPDNPMHWLNVEVVKRAEELGFEQFAFRLDDNPSLPAAYVKQLKAENRGLFYARYIDGLWVAAEGAIYSMLELDGEEAINRCGWDEVPQIERVGLGVDYGTAGVTHAVLLGFGQHRLTIPSMGIDTLPRAYVIGEWFWDAREQQQQLTDAQQVERLWKWLEEGAGVPIEKLIGRTPAAGVKVPIVPHKTAVDPSAVSLKRQMVVNGWPQLVMPEDELVIDGIRGTAALIGAGRMVFVKDAAPRLEGEMIGYVWDEQKAKTGIEQPVKQNDHGADALRYIVSATRMWWRWWLAMDLGPGEGDRSR
jgi:PBSX family phage terminase large subunit